MRTLVRSSQPPRAVGEKVKLNFPQLEKLDISIRTSDVTMVAGPPGAAKSTLTMAMVFRSDEPTLYFCADTSEHTIRVRAAAMLSGLSQVECEGRMYKDPDWAKDIQLAGSHVRWVFPDSPTIDDIKSQVLAYQEVMGSSPRIIVIDNLMDVVEDGSGEWNGLRKNIKELKTLARQTGSAIIVLHHTSEAHNFDYAPPMSSVQGKINQLPALILTVAKDDNHVMVGVVKNRYGQSNIDGSYYQPLRFDGATMTLGGRING